MLPTRLSLLTRLKDWDDQEGWREFFDTYGGAIHGFARRAGLRAEAADDVVQETLLSVAKQMPGFRYDRARGTFKGWLFQIVRRRIADHWREQPPAMDSGPDAPTMEEPPADPAGAPLEAVWDAEWWQNQLDVALQRAKTQVTARQWQMFDLFAVQQWPMARISALLGVNRAQVYMAKLRVGALVKRELAALADR